MPPAGGSPLSSFFGFSQHFRLRFAGLSPTDRIERRAGQWGLGVYMSPNNLTPGSTCCWPNGRRVRISRGVDEATLRTVVHLSASTSSKQRQQHTIQGLNLRVLPSATWFPAHLVPPDAASSEQRPPDSFRGFSPICHQPDRGGQRTGLQQRRRSRKLTRVCS